MKLALDADLRLATIDEVPVAAGAAVISPAWNDGIVGENCVEGDVGLVVVVEVAWSSRRPLPGRWSPRASRCRRDRLRPSSGPHAHASLLRACRPFRSSPRLQVLEQADEDGAFHQAEARVVRGLRTHGERGFVRLIEIPVPWMLDDEALVLRASVVQRPVGGDDVRIVVGAAEVVGAFLVPACPARPVERGIVVSPGTASGS